MSEAGLATGAARARASGVERAAIDAALEEFCGLFLDGLPAAVADAIRYSLLGEGKRLRPVLVLAAFEAAGGEGDASRLAAAVEVVHAYSLVHDDLPCMDDDDMRRGRATVHRVFGVAAATAAGLAMVPLAVRAALHGAELLGLDDVQVKRIVAELMRASGASGMIGGQLLDLEGEGRSLTLDELERIHRSKTGALIAAAVRIGGIAARADEARLTAFGEYGAAIGLAFQIADDVLDVTATTDVLGKTAGRDLVLKKSTYPALLGVEGANKRAAALVDDACTALARRGLLTAQLEGLARYVVARRN
ncbi:MAG: polyprenyl synthetase family protein [Gemmatimonadaceae bacterium]|nr:polyprenyl synthetase family protein [Gemmatimonadaceae bacterium]